MFSAKQKLIEAGNSKDYLLTNEPLLFAFWSDAFCGNSGGACA